MKWRYIFKNQIVSGLATTHIHDDFRTQECASTTETVSPFLGDRKGQRFAVAAAVATEVSGEVGGSVYDNLGGARR